MKLNAWILDTNKTLNEWQCCFVSLGFVDWQLFANTFASKISKTSINAALFTSKILYIVEVDSVDKAE